MCKLNATVMVPTLFCKEDIQQDGEDIKTVGLKEKAVLDNYLSSGWLIKIVTPCLYKDIMYLHYVVESPEQ